jgi:hypothetical protein
MRDTPEDSRYHHRAVAEQMVTGKRKWEDWSAGLEGSLGKVIITAKEIVYEGNDRGKRELVEQANTDIGNTPDNVLSALRHESHKNDELSEIKGLLVGLMEQQKCDRENLEKKLAASEELLVGLMEQQKCDRENLGKKLTPSEERHEERHRITEKMIKWTNDKMAVHEAFPVMYDKIARLLERRNHNRPMFIMKGTEKETAHPIQIVSEVMNKRGIVKGISKRLDEFIKGDFKKVFGERTLSGVIKHLQQWNYDRRFARNGYAHPTKRSQMLLENECLLEEYLSVVDNDDDRALIQDTKVAGRIYTKLGLEKIKLTRRPT